MLKLNQSLILKHLHPHVKDQEYHTAVFQLIQIREQNNYSRSRLITKLTMLVAKDRKLQLNPPLRHPLKLAHGHNLVCQHGEHSKILCTKTGNLDRRLSLLSLNLRPQTLCNRINQFKKGAAYSQMLLSHLQMLCSGVI